MYTLHPNTSCQGQSVCEGAWLPVELHSAPLPCCAGSAVHALAGQLWSAVSPLVVLPLQVFVWNALVSPSQPELTLSVDHIARLLGAGSADGGDQVCSLALWSTSG